MKKQNKVDIMVSYINNKYKDDTFEFVSMSGGDLGSNTKKITVSSKKYPDKNIRVICSETDGEDIIYDTYLNIKFEKETYEYIKNTLIEGYGENIYLKFYPNDTNSCKNGSDKTTFEEFISYSDTFVYFIAAVPDGAEDEELAFSKLKELFSDSVISGRVYFIDTDESLAENGERLIEAHEYAKRLYFVKDTVQSFSHAEWTVGE